VARTGGLGVPRARTVLEPLRLFAVALRFLTRLPLPEVRFGPGDLRRASALFPLVGLVVAGIGTGLRAALEPLWGAGVATVAALAAMILVTGALHEDGLADTADGLWGGWDPARRLEIMRDSRIGTYGTVALIVVLGLRASLLLPLGLADFARAVACGHVLGRASTLLLVRLLPAAPEPASGDRGERTVRAADGGVSRPRLGAAVVGPLSLAGAIAAGVVVLLTVLLATRVWAALPLAVALLVCLLCAGLFRRRLGGVTGDTLGAANQLVDLATIAVVAALAHNGLL
jgi:adenosylcobinamide-GDP ribazoletransferase